MRIDDGETGTSHVTEYFNIGFLLLSNVKMSRDRHITCSHLKGPQETQNS